MAVLIYDFMLFSTFLLYFIYALREFFSELIFSFIVNSYFLFI